MTEPVFWQSALDTSATTSGIERFCAKLAERLAVDREVLRGSGRRDGRPRRTRLPIRRCRSSPGRSDRKSVV